MRNKHRAAEKSVYFADMASVEPDNSDQDPTRDQEGSREDDLWFLPTPERDDDASATTLFAPLFQPPHQDHLAPWRAAAATLWRELSALSFEHGRLSERLRLAPLGAAKRLAIKEALDLVWWNGDHIAADRYHLWHSARIGAAHENAQGFARVEWVNTALLRAKADVADELERLGYAVDHTEIAGQDTPPIIAAAALFHLLRGAPARLRAAVLTAKIAAPKGMTWMPLSRAKFTGLEANGTEAKKLALWVDGALQSAHITLRELEAISQWQARATLETKDLSGRTPQLLITALCQYPVLGAEEAAKVTGVSRAAIERNFLTLQHRGLVRELTGQGRFRLWAAEI